MSPTSDLKSQTINGLIWSAIEKFGAQIIHLGIYIVLARQLLPEHFGLIAMLAVFIAVGQTFVDSGFGSALIQKQDTTRIHYSSTFYFNIALGLLGAAVLWLSAPYIASFYNQPELVLLTQFMALNLIIGSFGIIQTNIITKKLDFKTLTKVSLLASVTSGIIGITLAFMGFGVWSLAIQAVSNTLFRTALLWLLNSWRPSFEFSFQALGELFGYGSRLLASSLLDTVFQNIYQITIGKVYSATDLGYYTQARRLEEIPTQTLSSVVGRVAFPAFSKIQNDQQRLKKGIKKGLTTLVLFNFPLMIGLAVTAEPLVLVLLTEKWAPAIPYLQVLCIVGLTYPLHTINLNLLKAKGRSDLFLRLEIIKKVLVVVTIFITYRWGIMAMIYGQVVTSMVGYFINSYYTGQLIDYNAREQIKDVFPYLAASLFMGTIVYALGTLEFPNMLTLLIAQVITGMIVYPTLCFLLRLSAFVEGLDILQSKKGQFMK
ncbi:MOP flippase family protein [Heliorestis acidaminivorans]|uniref:MOP flippase family protein n=1 Tax=Heliorestis acidaminivorans TaxID=553427 RepID=UPI001479075C|nr:MOP flippase family protein [Heliorestis acidaminivorans]